MLLMWLAVHRGQGFGGLAVDLIRDDRARRNQGIEFSPGRQPVLALGFMLAALRIPIRDLVRPAWRPVDWLLRTPSRTNAFTGVVGVQAIYIVGHDG